MAAILNNVPRATALGDEWGLAMFQDVLEVLSTGETIGVPGKFQIGKNASRLVRGF
jgi:hypothetical protein